MGDVGGEGAEEREGPPAKKSSSGPMGESRFGRAALTRVKLLLPFLLLQLCLWSVGIFGCMVAGSLQG